MSETDQILADIEAAKARFEANISALAGGLPPGDELVAQAKKYGAIGGGAAVAVGVLGVVGKAKAAKKRRQRELDLAAGALAKNFRGVLPVNVNVPRQGSSPLSLVSLVAAAGALVLGALTYKKVSGL